MAQRLFRMHPLPPTLLGRHPLATDPIRIDSECSENLNPRITSNLPPTFTSTLDAIRHTTKSSDGSPYSAASSSTLTRRATTHCLHPRANHPASLIDRTTETSTSLAGTALFVNEAR